MDDVLRAVAFRAATTPSPLARFRDAVVARDDHGAFVLVAEGDGPDLNRAVLRPDADLDAVFAHAAAFFGPLGYSVVLEAPDADAVTPLHDALTARRWILDEDEPALVLHPLPARYPMPPPGLEIRPVTDDASWDSFEAVTRTPAVYLPPRGTGPGADFALFVAYADGRVVAASRVSCLGDIAEIMGVVVVEEMRRRGYGAALTRAAIAAGAARGCTSAMLNATEMGFGLYRTLGFVPVASYRTYLPPDS